MSLVKDIILKGLHSAIPAASTYNEGYLYYETDTNKLFRSNGSTWDQVAAASNITAYTDEQAQDAIGGMVDATLTYNDGTPSLGVSDILNLPTTEMDDTLVFAPDGAGGVVARAEAGGGGGGGGLTQSYLGYNTIGGTWTTIVSTRHYCKKITLAAQATILSVDIYLRPSTDNTSGALATVMLDNAGEPGVLVGFSEITTALLYLSNSASMPGAGRWVSFPIGITLPAGDYWIAFAGVGALWDIANDGSGADHYFTPGTLYVTGAYPSAWTITTGSVKYSIRANVIS